MEARCHWVRLVRTFRNTVPNGSRMGRSGLCLEQRYDHWSLLRIWSYVADLSGVGVQCWRRCYDSPFYGTKEGRLVILLGDRILLRRIASIHLLPPYLLSGRQRGNTFDEWSLPSTWYFQPDGDGCCVWGLG